LLQPGISLQALWVCLGHRATIPFDIAAQPTVALQAFMRKRFLSTLYRCAYPLAVLWWTLRSPVRIGVRGLVLDDEGRVLLVRHSYGREGWGFPGGAPKRREKLAATIVREVYEETGVECRVERLLGVYDSFVEGKSDHVALFVCRATRLVQPRPASPEIASAGYFAADQLPPGASDGTRRRIGEWQSDGPARWGLW
jgi:ADP-ribose pyrophosphatase YjhB (NUDIX family)